MFLNVLTDYIAEICFMNLAELYQLHHSFRLVSSSVFSPRILLQREGDWSPICLASGWTPKWLLTSLLWRAIHLLFSSWLGWLEVSRTWSSFDGFGARYRTYSGSCLCQRVWFCLLARGIAMGIPLFHASHLSYSRSVLKLLGSKERFVATR